MFSYKYFFFGHFKPRIYKTPLKLLIKAHTIFFSCLLSIFYLKICKVYKSRKSISQDIAKTTLKITNSRFFHTSLIYHHVWKNAIFVLKCLVFEMSWLVCLFYLPKNYPTLHLSSTFTCCPKVDLSTSADQS